MSRSEFERRVGHMRTVLETARFFYDPDPTHNEPEQLAMNDEYLNLCVEFDAAVAYMRSIVF